MLVLCVNAGALHRAQGYIDSYSDRIVLMEEGIWHQQSHANTVPVGKDAVSRGVVLTGDTANDQDIVTWIFEQEMTIVV